MNEVIKRFYEDKKIPAPIMKSKFEKLDKYPDVASEFEHWIKTGSYKEEDPLTVEGYTACRLASESKYLEGEGAFMMLIELRENPKKALNSISNGFKMK